MSKDDNTKLTTVKILKEVYSKFKRYSFDADLSLQKLVNRSIHKYTTDAEYRKLAVHRAEVKSYKQLFLTVNNNEIFDENLTRRIRSWLDVNAPGMKIGP